VRNWSFFNFFEKSMGSKNTLRKKRNQSELNSDNAGKALDAKNFASDTLPRRNVPHKKVVFVAPKVLINN